MLSEKGNLEEKMILYAVLQDIADELRRLKQNAEKEQRKQDQEHSKDTKRLQINIQHGVSER